MKMIVSCSPGTFLELYEKPDQLTNNRKSCMRSWMILCFKFWQQEHFLNRSVLAWCCLISYVTVATMFICRNRNGSDCKHFWQLSCSRSGCIMFVVRQLHFKQIYGNVATAALTARALRDRRIHHLLLWRGSSKSLMWLWLWPTCSLYVTDQGGRREGKETTGCLAGEEGLTQLMCYPSPSLPPIFLCTSVLLSCLSGSDVRWWCAVAWARD